MYKYMMIVLQSVIFLVNVLGISNYIFKPESLLASFESLTFITVQLVTYLTIEVA